MSNLLDDLLDLFGHSKKYLFIAIIAYILITVTIIVYIWWPKEKGYLEYESVTIKERQQQLAQEYINDVSMLFRTDDKQSISQLISDEYIEYTGKSRDEIVDELSVFFSLYADVRGMDLYVDKNTYVYSTTIYSNNKSRKINIIETYPYNYNIVFDDFYKYNKVDKTTKNGNIAFTVENIYRNLKYIELDMKIRNENSSYIRLDLNSANCVQAVLEDGKKYSVSNLISTSNYTEVESGATISKKFVFEIPAQLQNNIKHIVFNGVISEFSTANIIVEI